MSLPIVISNTAFQTFESICVQIKDRLGDKALKDFKKNTIKTLELISNSPLIYKETEFNPNIRQAVIKKLSSVFYEVKSDRIEFFSFGITDKNHYFIKKLEIIF